MSLPPPPLPPRSAADGTIKRFGWVLALIGVLLSIGMLALTVFLASTIAGGNQPGAASQWTGSPPMTAAVFSLFAAVFLFGLTALANGIWQIRYGTRNKILIALMLMIGLGLFACGWLVTKLAKT